MCSDRPRAWLLLIALVGLGCGAPSGSAATKTPGNASGLPSLRTLPSVEPPRTEWTDHMRFGWELAVESFQIEAPIPPPSPDARALKAWTDEELAAWLSQKSHAVESARRELDAAADEHPRQRIMAGAVVGLMYEDVARVLKTLPMPRELYDDPEIASVYREIVEAQVAPFLGHAKRAYRACAANAEGDYEVMAHWMTYCRKRLGHMPL